MKSNPTLEIGFLTIDLPTASDAQYSIMHDLAGAFGLDFNSEAAERFYEAWKETGTRRRIGCEQEADFVFVSGGQNGILEAAEPKRTQRIFPMAFFWVSCLVFMMFEMAVYFLVSDRTCCCMTNI